MPEFRGICCPSVTDVQPLAEAGPFPLPERHRQEMHKPTGKADNLITDDDDSMAVITRMLLGEDGVIPVRLVRLKGNTLSGSAHEFTTLSTFYEANKVLFNILCASGGGTPSDMTPDQIDAHSHELREEWGSLLSNVNWWKAALKDPEADGDGERQRIREDTLLGKPVGQLSLVGGYVLRLQQDDKIDRKALFERINAINWSVKDKMWEGVLMNPNKLVMSGKRTVAFASKFIAYLLGAAFDEETKRVLSEKIYGDPNHALPEPVLKA